MQRFDPTPRSTVRRIPARGVYDRTVINAILDEALVCHVGFVDDGQPVVIPMLHARVDDRLYIHGSNASRAFRLLSEGVPACVTVTLLDGLVLARSAFHHSANYRSVVVLAKGDLVRDRDEKNRILLGLVEHVVPGRWYDSRRPTEKELNATAVVGFPLDESSAKIRTGPPKDDDEDYSLPVWAGLLPFALTPGQPQPDPALPPHIPLPDYIRNYQRPGRSA
jgi:nitroimidazol reductase NimA-like FMN-containing flavoprotein (pyridoxamine 5'-phosphate oxidase superfamily)